MADSDIPGGGTQIASSPHLDEFAHGAFSARGEEDMEHYRDGAEIESNECPACGGPTYKLGTLGKTNHFRCRNCGQDSHTGT